MSNKKVTRVLVMLEYEPSDPDNGEVFDLTALVADLATKSQFGSCHLELQVASNRNYSSKANEGKGGYETELAASWSGYVCSGDFGGRSSHLADVMNQALPDNDRVVNLRRRAKALHKKADSVDYEAKLAKLDQVAAVRHQHPIARITESPLLAAVSEPTKRIEK